MMLYIRGTPIDKGREFDAHMDAAEPDHIRIRELRLGRGGRAAGIADVHVGEIFGRWLADERAVMAR